MTYLSGKYEDFSKWSYCNGRLVKVENEKIFQSGLIVIGDLPRWKCRDFSKLSHCNGQPAQAKNARFLKWSHCNNNLPKWKYTKIFQSDLMVMGDLPRWKLQWFFKVILL
jgi:hypothetical protein